MRLVGPQPLLMQYLDRYSTEQARRHEVHPGITGAQVSGGNAISWERTFTADVDYEFTDGSAAVDCSMTTRDGAPRRTVPSRLLRQTADRDTDR